MSNPFEPPDGPPPNKGGGRAPSPSNNPFDPPEPSSSGKESQSAGQSAPPSIPSNRPAAGSSASSSSAQPDAMDVSIPDEPPPAYSSAPAGQGEQSVQSGPSRMDFSGPPPLPDRFQNGNYDRPQIEQQITGVGFGYRPDPGPNPAQGQQGGSSGSGFGYGYAPPPEAPPSKGSFNEKPMSAHPTGGGGGGGAGPSRPPPSQAPDLSPTEVPTPGRPLLRKGQLLVYPKNHYCNKCGNTGYKNNDPNNPHDTDWRKYGKPYNSALQASYKGSVGPYANPATQASNNFQRPLPDFSRPPQAPAVGGGGWSHHPGNFRPPPPPPGSGWGGPPPPRPPQIFYQNSYMGGGMMPPGLVVKPGDPRIGGVPCWRCGGEGRELSFFGFDDGKCKECRGIGRLFHQT